MRHNASGNQTDQKTDHGSPSDVKGGTPVPVQSVTGQAHKGDQTTYPDGRVGPSPWPWRPRDGSGFDVISRDRHRVCTVHIAYRSSAEAEANTALIVAAPYMLEILRAIRARAEGVAFNRRADIARMVQSAIDKAEGR